MQALAPEDIKRFALAGNAILTIESGKTGKYYTLHIEKYNKSAYIVRAFKGSDNENRLHYVYIGYYYNDTKKFAVSQEYRDRPTFAWPAIVRAAKYFFDTIDVSPKILTVYHEGRCGKCGKRLTKPDSIKHGLGPKCRRYI